MRMKNNPTPWLFVNQRDTLEVDFSHPEMIKSVNETIKKYIDMNEEEEFTGNLKQDEDIV